MKDAARRITTDPVRDIETGQLLAHGGVEKYQGPVREHGGGGSPDWDTVKAQLTLKYEEVEVQIAVQVTDDKVLVSVDGEPPVVIPRKKS
jgi:hypothetical protein